MQTRQLASNDGTRTYALILETGDEVMASVRGFAERERLTAAHFSAIGAFSDAVLAYFDWETKEYLDIPVSEQVEVAALNGDVAVAPDGSPAVHIHAVLGRREPVCRVVEAARRDPVELLLEREAVLRRPEDGVFIVGIGEIDEPRSLDDQARARGPGRDHRRATTAGEHETGDGGREEHAAEHRTAMCTPTAAVMLRVEGDRLRLARSSDDG